MRQTFEQYLIDIAPSGVHTNNSPEGFERWLEEQGTDSLMEYAHAFGLKCYNEGWSDAIRAANEVRGILP